MQKTNENTPDAVPERCTKAEFARLLGVDAANVSRWASAKRVEVDDAGRVMVRPSLTRLLLTTDPSRGGRGSVRGEGSGGTIDRARALLERSAPGAVPASRLERLESQLAEALAQLELERKFRREWCYHHDDEATMRADLVDSMRAKWSELSAAMAAGDTDAFDRVMFRIEARIYSGMSPEEIAAVEPELFDGT
jgi:hypothetical protein